MAFGKRIAEITGVDITNLIHNVVESFADQSAQGLGESQHAPRKGGQDSLPSKDLCQVGPHASLGSGLLLAGPSLRATANALVKKKANNKHPHNTTGPWAREKLHSHSSLLPSYFLLYPSPFLISP